PSPLPAPVHRPARATSRNQPNTRRQKRKSQLPPPRKNQLAPRGRRRQNVRRLRNRRRRKHPRVVSRLTRRRRRLPRPPVRLRVLPKAPPRLWSRNRATRNRVAFLSFPLTSSEAATNISPAQSGKRSI